ncbi:DUF6516 family protein [Colwellia sp. MSW7]|uniref:DUF6516 family protein n=1 Tax=Colwellia maritima TaxID=2912588 RepID=A0ABS9X975_9GAMM|nr:DUF6516 family protein [Colwellia maritima]MCI2286031.1 DUF6516 family protein [Colwellia maritima]
MEKDPGPDVLLELHGTEYTEDNSYWYKIEAWEVEPSKEIPHGIRYNLTLHNNHNKRIMGFDNAHAVKSRKKGRFKGRIIAYDHLHKSAVDKGTPYIFSSAQQLLNDFFTEVNRILSEVAQ